MHVWSMPLAHSGGVGHYKCVTIILSLSSIKTLKNKKASPAKKARTSSVTRKKRSAVRTRPLHKQVLLHPFSVMVLLCVGVLLAGSTFRGFAADYTTTATVPAPLPTVPAAITSHIDEEHVSAEPITVAGTCPSGSFVKLYRNGAFSGVAQCNPDLTFQILTSLAVGANVLDPKVYNFTDQEGPAGTPVTVFYDQITLPPPAPEEFPANPPTDLVIDNVETRNYVEGELRLTSITPTITGFAPPYSDITIAFHSEVTYCKTKANGNGYWRCTLNSALDEGVHRVEVVAVTRNGVRLSLPAFYIRVIRGLANIRRPAPEPPFVITGEYLYSTKRVDQTFAFDLGISGGTAPYALTVDWGDGTTTDITQRNQSALTISHVYKRSGNYVVLVRGVDAADQPAVLQLSAVVVAPNELAGGGATSSSGGLTGGLRQWVWIVWPVYILVTLMVVSFWIGEQEGYRQLRLRHRKS